MKISQKTISVIGVLIILGLFFVRGPLMNRNTEHVLYEDYIQTPTKFDQINAEVKDTKRKLDSLNHKKADEVNEGYGFDGWSFDGLGIGKITKGRLKPKDNLTYLEMRNIGVNINEEIGESFLFYFEKNGQGYLSRAKLLGNAKEITEVYDNGKLISREGNKVIFINKKVNYNYSYANKSIIVPIKSKSLGILITILIYVVGLFYIFLALFILFNFFRFLMFVANNYAFEKGNIWRLKAISIAFFILAIKNFVINGTIYLIFSWNYPSDGVVMNYSFWERDYSYLILAILCWLIYTAFKQAMDLKQE